MNASPALHADARAQISAGLKLRALTFAVADALKQVGVVPTLLKGYALAVRLYPSSPLARPSTDVDVLVRAGELGACESALASLGLRRIADPGLEDPFEEHHHLSYAGPRGLVEVHFRLFTGFGGGAFDEAAVQARARDFALGARGVRVLAPEDEFLYLAIHAANHAFLRLSWLVDLERYLTLEPSLDWGLMRLRAERAGFVVAMTTTLTLLERLLAVQLPYAARRHFPQTLLPRALSALAFSKRQVTSARLAEHWLAAFSLRLLLVDRAPFGLRHLVDGTRRYLRRRARRPDAGR